MTQPRGAGGTTAADLEILRQIGTGLHEVSDTLGQALGAVSAVPTDAVGAVVGPVGGEFLGALLEATERHRSVLAQLTRVADAAGTLVLDTATLYRETEESTSADLRAAARPTEV